MKNAGKACNNRLYRHIRTFEKIIKNYFVISIYTIQEQSRLGICILSLESVFFYRFPLLSPFGYVTVSLRDKIFI